MRNVARADGVTRAHTAIAPSGEQIELSCGEQRVVVVEVGGGLRSYSVGDREVLDGYGLDERATAGRGQLLIPWPNRLAGGRYQYDGVSEQLALTEPEHANAIHGLVRWASWRTGERTPDRVRMEHTIHPQPGYPFTLGLQVDYTLADQGLTVRTTAENLGSNRCPYGCGQHPYLTLGTRVDSLTLTAPGRRVAVSDERGLPIGTEPVDGTDFDFRTGRPIGTTKLDNGFSDLERGADGLARIQLRDPDGAAVTLWADASYRYLMLFTGDSRPDVNRRSIAVEPMTCPADAFRTGESLISLEPGETTTSTWGITPW
jgi:aldose 1-epimerase